MSEDRSLEDRWAGLDRQVRSWWDGDLHRAQESEIRADPKGTLLFLPHPYCTPGGSEEAFPEMYAWDTFFINLGLLAHERFDLVRNHHINQLLMIERYGRVLNGNRTYYLTRSQTPLLAESIWRTHQLRPDRELLCVAYPLLVREYRGYWLADHHQTPTGLATNRDLGDPRWRPELAAEAEITDFTACFEGDVRRCNPLITNCALVRYAGALAELAAELGWGGEAGAWRAEAEQRRDRIRRLSWDEKQGFFFDFQFERGERLPYWSLAGYWPLWARVATAEQAKRCVDQLSRFEHAHGLAQTAEAYPSPHPEFEWVQFGYPAAWPPMQMIVIEALDGYGYSREAERLARKVLTVLVQLYEQTGKLWEKYNAVEGSLNLPIERYPIPPMHGWSSAAVAVLGRRFFGGR